MEASVKRLDRNMTLAAAFKMDWRGESLHGNQGKHRVTKRGPALSYPMFTLVTGIVGRWRAGITHNVRRLLIHGGDHSQCVEASHPWRGSLTMCGGFSSMEGVTHNVWRLLIHGGGHSQCVEASHPWRGSLTMCGGFSSMEGVTHNVWRLLIHGGDHSQCVGASHPWRESSVVDDSDHDEIQVDPFNAHPSKRSEEEVMERPRNDGTKNLEQ
ncbi:unnamed protein product [Ranitomeya imitator]|uniref:Uncharacterized protein n=1 Tax=Ranitomeya imitator TaxID=111125 RepID=A0ABN9LH01_9NEOB|nr:unnamed protein product [Ranitomeya imitator]